MTVHCTNTDLARALDELDALPQRGAVDADLETFEHLALVVWNLPQRSHTRGIPAAGDPAIE